MKDKEHREFAEALHHIQGKVALFGYHGDLMDEPYSGWHCIEAPIKVCHSKKISRPEVLWVNYEIERIIECQTQQEQAAIEEILQPSLL